MPRLCTLCTGGLVVTSCANVLSKGKNGCSQYLLPVAGGDVVPAVATALSLYDAWGVCPTFWVDDGAAADVLARIFPGGVRHVTSPLPPPREMAADAPRGAVRLVLTPGLRACGAPPTAPGTGGMELSADGGGPAAWLCRGGGDAWERAPRGALCQPEAVTDGACFVDHRDAAVVMNAMVAPRRTLGAPIPIEALRGAHRDWADLVRRALLAIHRKAPDFLGVGVPPEWLTHEHVLLADDRHPMPLLRVPQLPVRLDGTWVGYVPKAHCPPSVVHAAQTGAPPYALNAQPGPPVAQEARALADGGEAARAIRLLDAALAANRHDRAAVLTLAGLLRGLGSDADLLQVLAFHLDEMPDDEEARSMSNDALRRQFDAQCASCTVSDAGYRARGYALTAIVSTYASAAFIAESLADLEAQSMAQDMEIIVIDAASPEGEAAVVADFQKRYGNIRYIRTPERISIYAAWNLGVHLAAGQYIMPMSTNDRLAPTACEVLCAALEAAPTAQLAFGDTRLTEEPHGTFDSHTPTLRDGGAWVWPEYVFEHNLVSCTVGPHPVWRRAAHEVFGYFDTRYTALGDQDFFLRVGRVSAHVHVPEYTGLAWLSQDALSDASKTQSELLQIRHRHRAIHVRDVLEMQIFTAFMQEVADLAQRDVRGALQRLTADGGRLADQSMVRDLVRSFRTVL